MKKGLSGVGLYIEVILVLELLAGVLLYMKDCLDGYLAILIPVTVISLVLIVMTKYVDGDFRLTMVSLLLFQIGNLVQMTLAKDGAVFGRNMSIIFAVALAGVMATRLWGSQWAMHIEEKVPSHIKQWVPYMEPILLAAIYLMLLLSGRNVNGTRAWIMVGSFGFQATELAKLITIFSLGMIFGGESDEAADDKNMADMERLKKSGLIMGVNFLGLVLIRELGTLMILLLIFVLYLVIYMEEAKTILSVIGGLALSGMTALGISYTLNSFYQKGMVNVFTNIGAYVWGKLSRRFMMARALDEVGNDMAYQLIQGRKAASLGGWFGSRYNIQIPVADSDMVFPYMINRFGTIFALVVLFLFLALFLVGMKHVMEDDNRQELAVVFGFTCVMFLQSVLVIAGSLNLGLLMGLPVSFLSYGFSNAFVVFYMTIYSILATANASVRPPQPAKKLVRIE